MDNARCCRHAQEERGLAHVPTQPIGRCRPSAEWISPLVSFTGYIRYLFIADIMTKETYRRKSLSRASGI